MNGDAFRDLIERGDSDAVRAALSADASLANATIHWHLNQDNETDPLHYVSDCVAHGWLSDEAAAGVARRLIEAGALLDGSPGRESPLIGAASLGAERVAAVLCDAGADLECVALFGARALHWAAWTGAAATVARLIESGAEIEPRCTEFGATPLFWAVHGYGPRGPSDKRGQIAAARALLASGADPSTQNREGLPMLRLAREAGCDDMAGLLEAALASRP